MFWKTMRKMEIFLRLNFSEFFRKNDKNRWLEIWIQNRTNVIEILRIWDVFRNPTIVYMILKTIQQSIFEGAEELYKCFNLYGSESSFSNFHFTVFHRIILKCDSVIFCWILKHYFHFHVRIIIRNSFIFIKWTVLWTIEKVYYSAFTMCVFFHQLFTSKNV